jgi:hypothetical protein
LKRREDESGWEKIYNCSSPPSTAAVIETIGCNTVVFFEKRMNCSAQSSSAFAMDDANLQNIFFLAEFEIMGNQVLDISGVKGVKV